MLYRVHRKHKDNGSIGNFIDYVDLCVGHTHIHHFYNALLRKKIIPADWIGVHNISYTTTKITSTMSAFLLYRKITKAHLFYLYPVLSQRPATAYEAPIAWTINTANAIRWEDLRYQVINFRIPNGGNL